VLDRLKKIEFPSGKIAVTEPNNDVSKGRVAQKHVQTYEFSSCGFTASTLGWKPF